MDSLEEILEKVPFPSASSRCQRGIKSPKPTIDVVLLTRIGQITGSLEESLESRRDWRGESSGFLGKLENVSGES